MSTVVIETGSHGEPCTVSEMRKRLAQVLANLDGGISVSFAFHAVIKDYPPVVIFLPSPVAGAGGGVGGNSYGGSGGGNGAPVNRGIVSFETVQYGPLAEPQND